MGDLVLIILDERHDNYVLFTVSPTLYFLHSESLPALDLKPGEGGKCQSVTYNSKIIIFSGGDIYIYFLMLWLYTQIKSFGPRIHRETTLKNNEKKKVGLPI